MVANSRLRSLEYLRGIAALIVLYAHVVVVGGTDPVIPKSYFPMIAPVASPPEVFTFWRQLIDPEIWIESFGINSGHIGVGIFFLISGYVILRSLDQSAPVEFFLGRFFRIFPLAATVTLGGTIVFASYLALRHQPQTYSIGRTLLSFFLLPAYSPPVPVIWSLIAEVWFYVIMGLCSWKIKRIELYHIIVVAAACLAVATTLTPIRLMLSPALVSYDALTTVLWTIPYNMVFLIFILAGSAIYRARETGKVVAGVSAVACLFAMFCACARLYEATYQGTLGFDYINGGAALIVFLLFLGCEKYMPRMPIAKFFADISYPLYLVHIPLSWLLLFSMTRHGMDGLYAMLITCLICVALAYALHMLIEKPSHRYGKSFSFGATSR